MTHPHRYVLLEGGAVGHLMHPYDDESLTLGELKTILRDAAEGKVEDATEKLDGMNLVFTWDVGEGALRVARSGGDVVRAGMDAEALATKFSGRGGVKEAFDSAFEVLEAACSGLSPREASAVFGPNGSRWFSIEVVYGGAQSTIRYDGNNVVVHRWPVFQVTKDGVEKVDGTQWVDVLSKRLTSTRRTRSGQSWSLRGPAVVSLRRLVDGTAAAEAARTIDAAARDVGVGDDATLVDFLRAGMRRELDGEIDLDDDVASMVVDRALGLEGAPGLLYIKKSLTRDQYVVVNDFVKGGASTRKRLTAPLETAVRRFSTELLRGMGSVLLADPGAEAARLRRHLTKAMGIIGSSDNVAAQEKLALELERLGDVGSFDSPIEGVVFMHGGKAYKFTGSFAPVHQVLSMFKFDRPGIPRMDLGEGRTRTAPGRRSRRRPSPLGASRRDGHGPSHRERFRGRIGRHHRRPFAQSLWPVSTRTPVYVTDLTETSFLENSPGNFRLESFPPRLKLSRKFSTCSTFFLENSPGHTRLSSSSKTLPEIFWYETP